MLVASSLFYDFLKSDDTVTTIVHPLTDPCYQSGGGQNQGGGAVPKYELKSTTSDVKCALESGEDPKHEFIENEKMTEDECKDRCTRYTEGPCYGISHSNWKRCLLWLEPLSQSKFQKNSNGWRGCWIRKESAGAGGPFPRPKRMANEAKNLGARRKQPAGTLTSPLASATHDLDGWGFVADDHGDTPNRESAEHAQEEAQGEQVPPTAGHGGDEPPRFVADPHLGVDEAEEEDKNKDELVDFNIDEFDDEIKVLELSDDQDHKAACAEFAEEELTRTFSPDTVQNLQEFVPGQVWIPRNSRTNNGGGDGDPPAQNAQVARGAHVIHHQPQLTFPITIHYTTQLLQPAPIQACLVTPVLIGPGRPRGEQRDWLDTWRGDEQEDNDWEVYPAPSSLVPPISALVRFSAGTYRRCIGLRTIDDNTDPVIIIFPRNSRIQNFLTTDPGGNPMLNIPDGFLVYRPGQGVVQEVGVNDGENGFVGVGDYVLYNSDAYTVRTWVRNSGYSSTGPGFDSASFPIDTFPGRRRREQFDRFREPQDRTWRDLDYEVRPRGGISPSLMPNLASANNNRGRNHGNQQSPGRGGQITFQELLRAQNQQSPGRGGRNTYFAPGQRDKKEERRRAKEKQSAQANNRGEPILELSGARSRAHDSRAHDDTQVVDHCRLCNHPSLRGRSELLGAQQNPRGCTCTVAQPIVNQTFPSGSPLRAQDSIRQQPPQAQDQNPHSTNLQAEGPQIACQNLDSQSQGACETAISRINLGMGDFDESRD